MAVLLFFTKLVRIILSNAQLVSEELDEATRERMWQREEYLSREMTRLLQEQEQGMQEQEQGTQVQSGFAALQQWQFWAVAGVLLLLLLLFGLCWWLRKRSRQPASSSKEAGSGKKADEEEQELKTRTAAEVGRILDKRFWEPQQAFTVMDEMVEFYRISQRCEEKFHAAIAAGHRCKQILGRLTSV